MFILGNILIGVGNVIYMLLWSYQLLIIAAIIIAWVKPAPESDFIRSIVTIVIRLTEPVFRYIRYKLPQTLFSAGIDFTPIIVLIAIYLAESVIARNLIELGIKLKS